MEPTIECIDEDEPDVEQNQPESSVPSAPAVVLRGPPNAFEVLMSVRPAPRTSAEKGPSVDEPVDESVKAAVRENKKVVRDKLEKMSEKKSKKRSIEDDGEVKEVEKRKLKKRIVRIPSDSDSEGELQVIKDLPGKVQLAVTSVIDVETPEAHEQAVSRSKRKRVENKAHMILSDSDDEFKEQSSKTVIPQNLDPTRLRQSLLKLEPVSSEVSSTDNPNKRNSLFNYFNTVSKEEFESNRDKIKVSAHIHSPPSTPGRKSIPPSERKATTSARNSAKAQLKFASCEQIDLLDSEIIDDPDSVAQPKKKFNIFRSPVKSSKNKSDTIVLDPQMTTVKKNNKTALTSVKLKEKQPSTNDAGVTETTTDNIAIVSIDPNIPALCDADVTIINDLETSKEKKSSRHVAGSDVGNGTVEAVDETCRKGLKKDFPVRVKTPRKKKEQPAYLKGLKLRIKFPSANAEDSTSRNVSDNEDDDSSALIKTPQETKATTIDSIQIKNNEKPQSKHTPNKKHAAITPEKSAKDTEIIKDAGSEVIEHEHKKQVVKTPLKLKEKTLPNADMIVSKSSIEEEMNGIVVTTVNTNGSVDEGSVVSIVKDIDSKEEMQTSQSVTTPVKGKDSAGVDMDEKRRAAETKKLHESSVRRRTPQKKKEQPAYLKGIKLRIKFPGAVASSKSISDDEGGNMADEVMKTPTKFTPKPKSSSHKKSRTSSASKTKSPKPKATPSKVRQSPGKETLKTTKVVHEKSGKKDSVTKQPSIKTPTKNRSPSKLKSPTKVKSPAKSKSPTKTKSPVKAKSSSKDINKSKSSRSSDKIRSSSKTKSTRKINSPSKLKTSSTSSKTKLKILSDSKSPSKAKSSSASERSSTKGKPLKRLTTPTKESSRSKRAKLATPVVTPNIKSPIKTNSLTKLMSAAKEVALAKAVKSKSSQDKSSSSKSTPVSKGKSEVTSRSSRQSPRKVTSSKLSMVPSKTKSPSKDRKKPKSVDKSKQDKLVTNGKARPQRNCRKIVSDSDDDDDDDDDRDDYEDSEESDDDVLIIESKTTVKKAPSKLAPLFVSKSKSTASAPAPEKVIDPEVLAARQRFLNSGIPDCVRKTLELISVDEPEPCLFPTISHIQRKDETFAWNLPAAELTLLPLVDVSKTVPLPIEVGMFTNRNESKEVFNLPSPPSHVSGSRKILQHLKDTNPDFCVFRSFKRLRNKHVKSRNPQAAKAVEEKKPKRNSKRKRVDKSVEIVEEVKPAEDVSQVWTEKYKPMSSDEVIGNAENVQKLKAWLESWKKFRNCDDPKYDSIKRNRSLSGSSDEFINDSFSEDEDESNMPINTALIFGPCGSGKTASVYAVANELGYKVLEINASSKRTGKCLSKLQEATQSHRLCADKEQKEGCAKLFKTSSKPKKKKEKKTEPVADSGSDVRMSLILVENADIVFEELDEGFITALTSLSLTSKRPLVIVANDPECPHLARFHEKSLVVEFIDPAVGPSTVWLQLVCLVEGVNAGKQAIERLVRFYNGDLGRCLLQLQFWVLTGGNNLTTDSRNVVPLKQSLVEDEGSNMSWASSKDASEELHETFEHETCIETFLGNTWTSHTPLPIDFTGIWWNLAPMLSLPQVVPCRNVVIESSAKPRNNNCVDEILADLCDDDDKSNIFDRLKRKNKVEIPVEEVKVDDVAPIEKEKKAEWKSACSREDLASLASLLDDLSWMDVVQSRECMNGDGANTNVCARVWERTARDGVSVAQDVRACRANDVAMSRDMVHWVAVNSVAQCSRQLNGAESRDYDVTLPRQDNVRWLYDQWRADNTIIDLLPANTVLNHRAVLAAYSPFLRSACRSEDARLAANTKRKNRFFHYLRGFGLHPSDDTLNVLCATFSKGVWKCDDAFELKVAS